MSFLYPVHSWVLFFLSFQPVNISWLMDLIHLYSKLFFIIFSSLPSSPSFFFPCCMHRGQRTTFRGKFSLSTMWVSSSLLAGAVPHCCSLSFGVTQLLTVTQCYSLSLLPRPLFKVLHKVGTSFCNFHYVLGPFYFCFFLVLLMFFKQGQSFCI